MATEPGAPPEEKGHEHDQPGDEEEKQSIAGGHAVAWRCRLERCDRFRCIGCGRERGLIRHLCCSLFVVRC